jgi:hypothetical protein
MLVAVPATRDEFASLSTTRRAVAESFPVLETFPTAAESVADLAELKKVSVLVAQVVIEVVVMVIVAGPPRPSAQTVMYSWFPAVTALARVPSPTLKSPAPEITAVTDSATITLVAESEFL